MDLEENEHKCILEILTANKIVITEDTMNWMDAVYYRMSTITKRQ